MENEHQQMDNDNIPVVIMEDDYNLIKGLLQGQSEEEAGMTLLHEMNRAIIVKREAFPPHAVRLNSKVSIQNTETKTQKVFTIVMPEKADIRENRISILSPMGAALIGFRKGEEVVWKMPGGMKKIKILDVVNVAV
jgi:regulator of nucleoside diphosphate kinase